MARILVPLFPWITLAGREGGAGRGDGRVRLDRAAGYRLGMLLRLMMLGGADGSGAGQCTREHVFLAPEPGEKQ